MARDRIRQAFEKAKDEGRIALVPYVTIDFPAPGITKDIVQSLVEAGVDVVELGMPFSDPLGDGPTIQASGHKALENGVTPKTCINTVKEIRKAGIDIPIVMMGYYNNILSMGLDEFCSTAREAGAHRCGSPCSRSRTTARCSRPGRFGVDSFASANIYRARY